MSEAFQRVDRNIYKLGRGCFRVQITRRSLAKSIVKDFDEITPAKVFRDEQENQFKAGSPWVFKMAGRTRKTPAQYQAEIRANRRKSGLCLNCGDTKSNGRVWCDSCLEIKRIKYAAKMETV